MVHRAKLMRLRLEDGFVYHETAYEDIVSDPHELPCITHFLGCGHIHGLHTDLKKLNPYDLRESIKNYDAVADALTGTRYQWMME